MNEQYSLLKKILRTMTRGDPFMFYSSFFPISTVEPINVYGHQASLILQLMPRRPIRVLIGDEVGLGKTIEAIATLRYLEQRGEVLHVLVLLPRVLIQQWRDELMRMGVDTPQIHVLESKNLHSLSAHLENGYYLISIDLAKREEHLDKLKEYDWDALVVDEVHNCGTNKRGEAVSALAKRSKHVLLLSATPHRGDSVGYLKRLKILDPYIESKKADTPDFYRKTHNSLLFRRTKHIVNSVEGKEIFKRCEFITAIVDPTPEEKEFMEKLVEFIEELLQSNDYNNARQLIAVILKKRASSSPKAALNTFEKLLEGIRESKLREMNEDESISTKLIDDILGEDYTTIEVDEDEDIDDEMQDAVAHYAAILSADDEEKLTQLLEMGNRILNNDTKLNTVLSIIKNYIDRGEKVIVFTEYRDTLTYILPKLKEVVGEQSVVSLSGKNKNEFESIKREFWHNPGVKVLVATDVAAEGLNLQVASVVINYEPPWSPIKIDQRIGRVWRIGQTKDVNVYNIVLGASGDKDVVEKLYTKIMNVTEALEDTKPLLGRNAEIYKVTATAERGLWKVDPELSDEKESQRPSKISEFNLILGDISGDLDKHISALLHMLKNLNRKVEEYSIFPREKADNIRDMLNKICSTTNIDRYKRALEDLHNSLEKTFPNISHTPVIDNKLPKLILSILNNYLKDFTEDINYPIELVSLSTEFKRGSEYEIYIVGNDNWEIPVIFKKKGNKVLIGAEALEYIVDVFKGPVLVTANANINKKGDPVAIMITKTKPQKFVTSISKVVSDYEDTCKIEARSKCEQISTIGQLKVNLLAKIVHVPQRSVGPAKSWSSTADKANVEEAAIIVVMEYEKANGRKPRDVSSNSHYDIESVTSDGETRYIEVKGHKGFEDIYAELTEKEYEEAQRLGEKYWLYIVVNLRETPKGIDISRARVFEFRDPLNTMEYEIYTTARVILRPKNVIN